MRCLESLRVEYTVIGSRPVLSVSTIVVVARGNNRNAFTKTSSPQSLSFVHIKCNISLFGFPKGTSMLERENSPC